MAARQRRGLAGVLAAQTDVSAEDTVPALDTAEADAGPVPAPSVPLPYETTGDGALDAGERADLAACEAAIDGLRLAFWAAGKALQVVRDARLYREQYPTFDAYCVDRWELQRAYADRLIRAWPLAEVLTPIGVKINEGQIRELLPLADQHGQDAAVAVYRELAQAPDIRVTAALIRGAVAVLPADQWDPAAAADQIRAYLAGELTPEPAADTDPAEAWEAEATRLRTSVRRAVTRPAFRAALRAHPDQARAVVAELRALLDEVERETGAAGA